MKTEPTISLNHGSGGKMSQSLIKDVFAKYFYNGQGHVFSDSAIISSVTDKMAFTTDSYVIDPIFFPGGDIGKLAICGTVNDLAVSGATPQYISCGFIIEEGLEIALLELIVLSMQLTAKRAGVNIVAGDTKVVDHGKCDKLFINTSGVGLILPEFEDLGTGNRIKIGDKIIINGGIAEHGMAILAEREGLKIETGIISDCAPLNHLIEKIKAFGPDIKFIRDATRGGVATVLNEITEMKNIGIEIEEENIPVKENVRGICDLLGFDPLYVANEGKVVIVVSGEKAEDVLSMIQKDEFGKDAAIIGEVVTEHKGMVVMQTDIGGRRIIDMLAGEQLPRIC